MHSGIIGFVLGGIAMLLTLALIQRFLVSPIVAAVLYKFYNYVFDEPEFPSGDIENGRMLRRCLLPFKITITFYNSKYQVVKQADQPGRYGAVVQINCAGVKTHRFITLYRVPAKIFWWDIALTASSQLPPGVGLDPLVVQAQQQEIGNILKDSFIDDTGTISPRMAILLAGLSEISPNAPPLVKRTGVMARDADWWFGLRQQLGLAAKYHYLADLPHGYHEDSTKQWPLILFLDHADNRGNDLSLTRNSGLPGEIARGKKIPAIVISPQCPATERWNFRVLAQLLDEAGAKYRIDANRIYVIGISAGGDTAWDVAIAYPDRFAAIIPMSGGSDPADATRLKDIPLWAFHGQDDTTVPATETTKMIEAIRQAGGHPHVTLFSNAGHAIWDKVFTNDAVYTWLLAQKRGQPEVITPGVPEFEGASL